MSDIITAVTVVQFTLLAVGEWFLLTTTSLTNKDNNVLPFLTPKSWLVMVSNLLNNMNLLMARNRENEGEGKIQSH